MHIIITCTEASQKQWLNRFANSNATFVFSNNCSDNTEADAYFYLLDTLPHFALPTNIPVFINAQTTLLSALPNNCIRINAWNGFLEKEAWELSCSNVMLASIQPIFSAVNISYLQVPDIIGFISNRVIAMIINEAYFTLAEGVSDKAAIDIAMKLGTNYPFGPFEWSQKIGLHNVVELLQALHLQDDLYTPCSLMLQELNNTPCP